MALFSPSNSFDRNPSYVLKKTVEVLLISFIRKTPPGNRVLPRPRFLELEGFSDTLQMIESP
ncbi:MAG: hypothetical protein COV66_01925 [Nitrospinae bacterium CG11_big_fil_rev_8_21_14_0_20_45_15]|nr:MAG: hypothetical protein COV66_01925 [Nitrospinae bacterium CG11_big_fil_rev_8_21_14_0_20_45_15]